MSVLTRRLWSFCENLREGLESWSLPAIFLLKEAFWRQLKATLAELEPGLGTAGGSYADQRSRDHRGRSLWAICMKQPVSL